MPGLEPTDSERTDVGLGDFFAGLSLARAMPGANVLNLSIWIGHRLRGGAGALAAVSGVLAAPMMIIIGFAVLYQHWRASTVLQHVLLGIASAALGLSLSMGLKSFWVTSRHPFHAAIVLMVFFAVGVLHWPMLPVVIVLVPISVTRSFLRRSRTPAREISGP